MAEKLNERKACLAEKDTSPIDSSLVLIQEHPHTCKINLRGAAEDTTWQELFNEVTGINFPRTPNTLNRKDQWCIFWLGPNEWLLSARSDDEQHLLPKLKEACEKAKSQNSYCAVTDVTESRTIIEVSGPYAEATLSKACPLDLSPKNFPEDTVAQSYFGHAFMLYHRLPGQGQATFHLYPLLSFAPYVWDFLVDAAQEWQAYQHLSELS